LAHLQDLGVQDFGAEFRAAQGLQPAVLQDQSSRGLRLIADVHTRGKTQSSAGSGSSLATLFPPAFRAVRCGPHQFRTRNDRTETQRTRSISNENAAKSTNLVDIPSLITVWLQVRVLPGPPRNQLLIRPSLLRSSGYRTRNASPRCSPYFSSPQTTDQRLIWPWSFPIDRSYDGFIARKGPSSVCAPNERPLASVRFARTRSPFADVKRARTCSNGCHC